MPEEIKKYACSICGHLYDSLELANRCEAKGNPKLFPTPMILCPSFFDNDLDYRYSKQVLIDEDIPSHHYNHPKIFVYNNSIKKVEVIREYWECFGLGLQEDYGVKYPDRNLVEFALNRNKTLYIWNGKEPIPYTPEQFPESEIFLSKKDNGFMVTKLLEIGNTSIFLTAAEMKKLTEIYMDISK